MCLMIICCHDTTVIIALSTERETFIYYAMSLILLNLQSNQLIKLDNNNSLIIGRGNVEGCFDKRVSRNHGRITCTVDGKIRLEALHCNPCFFTRNGVPPIHQLNKNEEETLNKGDYLGLLPNAFWFKITSENEADVKKESEFPDNKKTELSCENKTDVLADNNNGSTLLADETIIPRTSRSTRSNDTDNEKDLNTSPTPASNSEHSENCFGTAEFEKTRRLPLWMYEIDEPETPDKSPNKRSSSSKSDTNIKKPKILPETKIKKESDEVPENKVDNTTTVLDVPSTSNLENTDQSQTSVFQSEFQSGKESNCDNHKKEGYESDVNNEAECDVRPICQYEGNCFRKNPQHKLEFSHPGDSDYVPYEQRPLCQYGAACYRRNEKHRVEFRHPSADSSSHNISPSSSSSRGSRALSPLPAKRRRKKVKKANSDYGDDDEYELEDPFINDASSDEYVPSDLESEEQEDLDASREDD